MKNKKGRNNLLLWVIGAIIFIVTPLILILLFEDTPMDRSSFFLIPIGLFLPFWIMSYYYKNKKETNSILIGKGLILGAFMSAIYIIFDIYIIKEIIFGGCYAGMCGVDSFVLLVINGAYFIIGFIIFMIGKKKENGVKK